jgi:hypothetical protein
MKFCVAVQIVGTDIIQGIEMLESFDTTFLVRVFRPLNKTLTTYNRK